MIWKDVGNAELDTYLDWELMQYALRQSRERHSEWNRRK